VARSLTVKVGRSHETPSGTVELPVPGVGGAHWIVGGSTGSGKTQFLNAAIAGLAPIPNLALAISDVAWVDYDPWWRERPSCMSLGPDGALSMLDLVESEMMRRLPHARRLRQRTMEVTAEFPRVVAIFDEVSLFASKKGAHDRMAALAAVGRKVNIGCVFATQVPSAPVLPTKVKAQCPVRIGFRCKGPEQTDAIFETQRIPAHKIPPSLPGVAFLDYETTLQLRAPLITDEECMAVDADTSSLRPELGWPRVIDPMLEGANA
jgi:S-DNA-T family DNA segregation ATPase FtsK/SpoIIIE